MPLTQSAERDDEALMDLQAHSPETLFPDARNAEVAYSALLLRLGAWQASHDLTNDDESPEGCFLHAIIHRMEPNPANSAYWWRQLGQHPAFRQLHSRAQAVLSEHSVPDWKLKATWDPLLFNMWCEQAQRSPGTEREKAALAIQQAEWELLFNWSAERAN
ncbi:MAG TPA: hypothetical protein VH302_14885 [Bryobacteraceae bacterium]|nr:hypothetical protein [Bryobacteraceae bacterium]